MINLRFASLFLRNTQFRRFQRFLRSLPAQREDSLFLTDSCVQRLKELESAPEVRRLRLQVEGGGCSGFQYKFSLDSRPDTQLDPTDFQVERDGARLLIDEETFGFVRGSIIDFERTLIRTAFRILSNPIADKKCSCGSSFTPKTN